MTACGGSKATSSSARSGSVDENSEVQNWSTSAAPITGDTEDFPKNAAIASQEILREINASRLKAGLKAVKLDEQSSFAAQKHAEDMLKVGFTGHLGSDGSWPEQRMSVVGVSDYRKENAGCAFGSALRGAELSKVADSSLLELIHQAFMAEVAPADGHKRNILQENHESVGIGAAWTKDGRSLCLVHEFGREVLTFEGKLTFDEQGGRLAVEGEVSSGKSIMAVGIKVLDMPSIPTKEELMGANHYLLPEPDKMALGPKFSSEALLKQEGSSFSAVFSGLELPSEARIQLTVWEAENSIEQEKEQGVSMVVIGVRTLDYTK